MKEYESFKDAEQSLVKYFHPYNYERIHEALNCHMSAEIYFGATLKEKQKNKPIELLTTDAVKIRMKLMPNSPKGFIIPISDSNIQKPNLVTLNCQFIV